MGLLTRLALRRRIVTLVALALLMAGGVYSVTQMKIELFPNVDFPLISLITAYPEADPETVLQGVTIPLESAFEGLDGLERLRSVSSPGLSLVIAEFEFGTDMKRAASTAAQKVAGITLPAGVRSPRVARVSPEETPILQLSVLWEGHSDELLELVTVSVLPALQDLEGVFNAEVPVGAGITRTNGEPSLPVTIAKKPDANTVSVVERVLEGLEGLKPRLPSGVEFVTLENQAPRIRDSIESLERETLLGALFTIAVIFAFLLSVRPTLVSSISIPASILGALIIMRWTGMTLNIMTIGGLAIAVGRVVDDSIVVLENVYRHIQQGDDRLEATVAATREVAGAIITSTLTTIAVFLPLTIIGGIIGAFFLPFALTVTYALLVSLVVALTVVPVLGSLLIKPADKPVVRDTWLQRAYTPLIRWALGHKAATLAVALVLFAGSFGLLGSIPRTFLPSSGNDRLTVGLTLPPGATRDAMLLGVGQVEAVLGRLRDEGAVDAFEVTVGAGGPRSGPGGGGFRGSNSASFMVLLTGDADAAETASLLRSELVGGEGAVVVTEGRGGGPASSNRLELVLTGADYDEVSATAARIVVALQGVEGVANVGGDASATVVDGRPGPGTLSQVSRVDGRRAVTITGSIIDENLQEVNRRVDAVVDRVGLPAGVGLETGGVFADIREAFSNMARAMVLGILLVYLVMVISMRSLRTPFVIILSLPLASIGAVGALFITQRALGLPALIGLLMLIGLVVTNAIVLISFVEQLRARGLSLYDALIEGGRTRIRPIMMTAFTTSFALLPLAVVAGGEGILSAGLATVVIGGLLTSTFLTLVVIPVVYSLLRRDGVPRRASAAPRGESGG